MKNYSKLWLACLFAGMGLWTACSGDDPSGSDTPDDPDTPAVDPNAPLKGTIIGSQWSVDYATNTKTTLINTKANVFDEDYNTYFASYDRSGTWVGLDLGKKHVITKVGYSPRIGYADRVTLAVIEGANKEDFSDAMPILLIKSAGVPQEMNYTAVNCSRGFRYVRYVTPNDQRCNLAELQFFGTAGEGNDSQLYQVTNLPLVVINTAGAQAVTSKEYELSSTVYIISDEGKSLLATEETGVRGRGNASWQFPKKPLRLKFAKKQRVLDAPAKAKKWTLINNYGDKTLMRNMIAFEISRRIGMAYTPYCRPVDVIMNGEYQGCYQLCDQVEVNEGRVEITEMEPTDLTLPNLSGGYFIEIDAYAYEEKSYFYSMNGTPVTIKSPDDEDIVRAQSSYINDYFNQMEKAVFSSDFADEEKGYRKYLDLDSFLKHFIVGELCGNTDTYWSVYMSKDRNSDKFFTGPVWDFDIAFDNDYRTYPISNHTDFVYATGGSAASDAMIRFVNAIVKEDTAARHRLAELWQQARNEQGITEESLMQYIDETSKLLSQSQALNFKRWNILSQWVHMNPVVVGYYDGEVNVVKKYLKNRLPKLDEWLAE